MGAVTGPTGQEWRGLTANLALSSLPVVTLDNSPRGVHTMHAGTFLMQKQFDPPVDVKGCHLFDIQLYVSAAVPVTVYLDTGMKGLRSDLQLHAGAQIARVDIRNHRARWPEFRDWDQKIRGIKIDFWPQDNFYPYPQTQDVQVVLVGITARNHDQTPESLPHRGEAVWLTHFRPNLPHGVYRLVDSGPRVPIVGMQHLRQVGGALDYERYSPERFRSSTPNGLLSPIFAILTGPRPSQAEQQAAGALQEYLQRSYGVRLPINPSGRAPGPDTGNVVVIGRQAALATGLVTEAEFRRVGAEGFVLRSRLGRIAIAGADDPGTLYGVSSFLQEQGVRFCGPGEPEQVADYQEDGFLHETYLLDWPWFKDRPVPGGWRLRTQGGDQTPPAQQATTDPDSVRRLAAAIKDCARHQEPVPQTVLADAGRSRLSTYVAARLLWDPFLDTSRLIEAFEAAGSRGAQARLPGMRAADRG